MKCREKHLRRSEGRPANHHVVQVVPIKIRNGNTRATSIETTGDQPLLRRFIHGFFSGFNRKSHGFAHVGKLTILQQTRR